MLCRSTRFGRLVSVKNEVLSKTAGESTRPAALASRIAAPKSREHPHGLTSHAAVLPRTMSSRRSSGRVSPAGHLGRR
jgi:hypothetical protein